MSRLHAGLGLLCWITAAGCGADTEIPRDPSSGGTGGTQANGGVGNPTAGFGNPGGSSSGGSTGGSGVSGSGNSCATVKVTASRVIPTVQLVIDGSGSMEDNFGNTTRWAAVHDALLGNDGIVQRLESVVEFGMSIYQTGQAQDTCPELTGPAPALGNYQAINDAWIARPNGSTPTAEAMESVVASMSGTSNNPDEAYAPQIIILATDGAPNGCGVGIDFALWFGCLINPMDPMCAGLNMMLENDGYERTLEAAREAQAKGIDVYVLDLSDGGINQAELQKVANVGVGLMEDATPPAPLYVPADPAALATALETIIGGAATCSLALEGEITDLEAACSAASEVLLNGQTLNCDDENGWRTVDATHIELVGEACTGWLGSTDATLSARFPCDVVIVQ